MPLLVQEPLPVEVEALLNRRRQTGADRYDEVWEGVLHMNPFPSGVHMDLQQQLAELLGPLARAAGLFPRIGGINLGDATDYRGPDGALQRERSLGTWHPTAALVLEIISPNDHTWEKLPFYAAHEVDELLIVDPQARKVDWLALDRSDPASSADTYRPIEQSALIDLGPARLTALIDWPPTGD